MRTALRLACLLLAGVFLFAGCGGQVPAPPVTPTASPVTQQAVPTATAQPASPTPAATTTIAAQPASTEVDANNDPEALQAVGRAIVALARARSGRLNEVQADIGQGIITTTMEVVAPDRFSLNYITQNLIDPHPVTQPVEAIVVGTDEYRKDGSGPWTKEKSKTGFIGLDWNLTAGDTLQGVLSRISDAKYSGMESVSGQPAAVYGYAIHDYPLTSGWSTGGEASPTVALWVSTASGYPLKMHMDTHRDKGPQSSFDAFYYDLNTDIKIEPPVP